jgi:putative transposase
MLQRGYFAARSERTVMNSVRSVIQRKRFPLDIMLMCVRWHVAYLLSLRNLEEMMQARGLFIDHSTIHPGSSSWFRCWRKPFVNGSANAASVRLGKSWRLDETYIKIRGEEPVLVSRG